MCRGHKVDEAMATLVNIATSLLKIGQFMLTMPRSRFHYAASFGTSALFEIPSQYPLSHRESESLVRHQSCSVFFFPAPNPIAPKTH